MIPYFVGGVLTGVVGLAVAAFMSDDMADERQELKDMISSGSWKEGLFESLTGKTVLEHRIEQIDRTCARIDALLDAMPDAEEATANPLAAVSPADVTPVDVMEDSHAEVSQPAAEQTS